MKTAVGIDIGGTNMRAALVNEAGEIVALERTKTPIAEGPERAVQELARMVSALATRTSEIIGIGIGCPGPLSRSQRTVFDSPNLPGFNNFPLGESLEKATQIETWLDNDAKCATYGEGLFGAAKGLSHYILLTLGTGIGGGVIADGRMIYGKSDNACEIGHMTLYPGGVLCNCGNRGCFEKYASATAIHRRAKEASGRELSARETFAAFESGEAWADKLLREVSLDLAIGTASLVNIFDPQAVVFGGGIFTTGGGPMAGWVQEMIRDRCFKTSQHGLKILPSALGGNAGVLGAASRVFRARKSQNL
jgi:glucokinase